MKLGDLVNFSYKCEDCDFWLIAKGSDVPHGKPTKKYSPNHIGVKVIRDDLLDSKYLYYYFEYLQNMGFFKSIIKGTINLFITIDDLKSIKVNFSD